MKVKIIFLLLFLSLTAFSYGQTVSPIWKNISPEVEEFSIDLPGSQYFEYKNDSEGKLTSARYGAKSDSNWFYIFSGEDFDQTPLKLLIPFAEKNNAKPEKLSLDGFSGEKYSFLDSEGFHQSFLTIKASNRSYVFHIVGFSENKEIADRFFESLKLKNPNLSEKTQDKTSLPNEKQPEKIVNPDLAINLPNPILDKYDLGEGSGDGIGTGRGVGIGRGTGRGSGSGTGNGDGVAKKPPPPPPVVKNTPLKLLSKPKPSYTDLARYYGITGSVLLRVIFLSTGKIGQVSVYTKLPFGLTDSAKDAAQRLAFEAPTRNREPYSIAKRIQYNFTIY